MVTHGTLEVAELTTGRARTGLDLIQRHDKRRRPKTLGCLFHDRRQNASLAYLGSCCADRPSRNRPGLLRMGTPRTCWLRGSIICLQTRVNMA